MTDTATNRLARERSPYLLQHAHNPVDWHPWGDTALRLAREQDKPILLSIGYFACHWCHVMAHESFEDPATAALMNALFVNIKVDREERPDLDRIYQLAHQMLTGRGGGWPLTVFLTPDQVPFFAGTYFPKQARYGLPAFADLLTRVDEYYRQHRAAIDSQNAQLLEALAHSQALAGSSALTDAPLRRATAELKGLFDGVHGGFGGAPKFPQAPLLERCLREHARTGDQEALRMALLTLEQMARGGIHDHLGGGFFRYAVDGEWTIPHFEKMLYDNAQLLRLYAQAAQITQSARFDAVLHTTGHWALRELRAPDGGFYAALDADSEGEEGRFYVWDRQDVQALLSDEEYAILARRFGLDDTPNFKGRWHLRVVADVADIAKDVDLSPQRVAVVLSGAMQKLFAARSARVRPAVDDKVLAGWNGLMIGGLAQAGRHLNEPIFIEAAAGAADFARRVLWQNGRLHAAAKDGVGYLRAYLDDHAYLLDGLLELLQARWDAGHLAFAVDLADAMLTHFEDRAAGGFFHTADDHEALIVRTRPLGDDATPAGTAIAARALGRLGHLLGEVRYLDAAARAVASAAGRMQEHPLGCCSLLAALEEQLTPPQTLILRGDGAALAPWLALAREGYRPRRLTLAIPADATDLPGVLAHCRPQGEAVAYLCQGGQCSAPLTRLEELAAALDGS
ncbi:thioredoxin domain-containing protein [Immundisolibacter sp.]|uniref:thioredoxin domain-containing protein n=1 Tax=Immundisolibacter sp. TaxID=1934948 RepID=UPI002624989C|nr:thioredoxin domain-containing protein [Immundisolibacter sp.]MDD3649913.1 thioredoxin domain-containing protein [Immundisolibacter sp.]